MSNRKQATVYIIDDDGALLDAVRVLLKNKGFTAKVFNNPQEFLDAYLPEPPGCLILDILLPGIDGLELQHTLKDISSLLPIIFISDHADIPIAVEAKKAGAFEFLQKPFSDMALLDCIIDALALNAKNRNEFKERQAVNDHIAKLSPREHQVMLSVAAGKANKRIARDLGLSPRTVEIYRSHVMLKMQVDSTIALVNLLNENQEIAE